MCCAIGWPSLTKPRLKTKPARSSSRKSLMSCRCREVVPMKPNLQQRRVVKVQAGQTWEQALKHRIYSCPDTDMYERVWGATCLILNNNDTRERVPLEVTT